MSSAPSTKKSKPRETRVAWVHLRPAEHEILKRRARLNERAISAEVRHMIRTVLRAEKAGDGDAAA